jgi:K+-sensing histidine kinase KdpD
LVNVRDCAKEKIESGRLKLEIDSPPDVGTAHLDETRMTTALFNLLWNSIMFQSDGDAIVLQAPRRGDQISIEIVNSVGIVTSSELANVYETSENGDPFVRRTGSGLGLALNRSLVEIHSGSLEIRNDAERGTHAAAYFPVAGPALIATKAPVTE